MILSARALLGAAPALVVLGGSLAMARMSSRETTRTREAAVVLCESTWSPSPEVQDRMHRVAMKQEAVEDLLEGRLTLRETTLRFESLAGEIDAGIENLPSAENGDSICLQSLNQVLTYARLRSNQEPDRFGEAMKSLEQEASRLTNSAEASAILVR